MKTFIGDVNIGPFLTLRIELDESNTNTSSKMDERYKRLLDLKPIMEKIPELVIFPSELASFAAEGRPKWAFKGYQSTPPMVKSGLMKRGLTTRDSGLNTIVATENSLSFTLNPAPYTRGGWSYPALHQHGSTKGKINQNIVLNLQPEDVEKIKALIIDYVETGNLGGLHA